MINQDAVRIMKELYGIDMEKSQRSKLLSDIPPCSLREDWGLVDPTGKSDEEFIKVIEEIETKILELKRKLSV